MVNLIQLEVLVAVAESGGFTGAAKKLYMSQPSVSNHIRNLENSLGVKLVLRSSTGTRTTAAGDMAVEHARKVFAQLDSLEHAAAGFQGLDAGRLTVAGTTTLGTYLLPRLLADFARRAPNVECQIRVGNERTVEDWLLEGGVALGLCADIPAEEQLAAQPMLEEAMVLVAPAGTPLTGRRVKPEELVQQRFLMREVGSATRRQQLAALRLWGLEGADQWELWGSETLKQSVHAGLGLALLSEHVTARERASGMLAAVEIDPPPPPRMVYLVRRADRVLTPPEEAFVALIGGISLWPS